MIPDPACLRTETMRAECTEALRWFRLGERTFALFHIRRALGLASKLKDARARRNIMRAQNIIRRKQ